MSGALTLPPTPPIMLMEKIRSEALVREDAFGIIDLAHVRRRLDIWRKYLPIVRPFYAVKCNADPSIIAEFAKAGEEVGFDCASRGEIELAIVAGVHPSRIIFANPFKAPSQLRYAREKGVRRMTFDSVEEVEKIARLYPDAELVLRIHVDDRQSLIRLGLKFGAHSPMWRPLLLAVKSHGLSLVGVSFHVGCCCKAPNAYTEAIALARRVFDLAEEYGLSPHILDIGGGFGGGGDDYDDKNDTSPSGFPALALAIRTAIRTHFPPHSGVDIIAEPGRFFVEGVLTLATQVIGRTIHPGGLPGYYISDGVLHTFSSHPADQPLYLPVPLNEFVGTRASSKCIIWGQTCDSSDLILEDVTLPVFYPGEWLIWRSMGAYMTATTSHFNGFSPTEIIVFDSTPPSSSSAKTISVVDATESTTPSTVESYIMKKLSYSSIPIPDPRPAAVSSRV